MAWQTINSSGIAFRSLSTGITETKLISELTADELNLAIPYTGPTIAERKNIIAKQIDVLEQQQFLSRITRESILEVAINLASLQGITEAQFYLNNSSYKKIKDIDNVIIDLRAQMAAIV